MAAPKRAIMGITLVDDDAALGDGAYFLGAGAFRPSAAAPAAAPVPTAARSRRTRA